MFCEEIRTKQYLSYISFCPLRILYNSKFIIMATSFGTNSIVVTRAHCIKLVYNLQNSETVSYNVLVDPQYRYFFIYIME